VIGGGNNSDRDGQESDVEKSGAVLDTVERSSERIAESRDPDGPICKKDRRECRDRWRNADTVADRSAERDNFAKLSRIEFQLRHVPVDHVDKELGEEIRGTKSKEAGRPWFAERYWESFPVNER
jgi:hypothetical protein